MRALTGTDPDRWAEEKARGLTIDLGFAVDHACHRARRSASWTCPGHGRFVKNMLAGVGAVDACLFVVAATEGWKPQSEEHLRILELLGVTQGVVALTKVGLVDDDDRRAGGAGASRTGWPGPSWPAPRWSRSTSRPAIGVDELRAALDRLVGRHAGRRRSRPAPAVGRPVVRRCGAPARS